MVRSREAATLGTGACSTMYPTLVPAILGHAADWGGHRFLVQVTWNTWTGHPTVRSSAGHRPSLAMEGQLLLREREENERKMITLIHHFAGRLPQPSTHT